jgi:hypothetical protein
MLSRQIISLLLVLVHAVTGLTVARAEGGGESDCATSSCCCGDSLQLAGCCSSVDAVLACCSPPADEQRTAAAERPASQKSPLAPAGPHAAAAAWPHLCAIQSLLGASRIPDFTAALDRNTYLRIGRLSI